jgi:hypothetical protein
MERRTVEQLGIDDVAKRVHRTRNIGEALGECSVMTKRVINHWCDVIGRGERKKPKYLIYVVVFGLKQKSIPKTGMWINPGKAKD